MKRIIPATLVAMSLATPAGAQVASFDWFAYSGSDPTSAIEPSSDEYRNPILQGFYPDPSITRVGDDFYLVHSTFSYFPGIPVFHSRDLVNWTQIGNAIDRPDQLDFARLGLSRGVFAPTIEHHDGTYWILNTCVDCGDNFLVTASDPAGPWSDPVWLPDLAGGIDPGLFFDDDGSAWIVNNGPPEGEPRYEGHRAIWIQRFDPVNKVTIGPRKVLVDGGVDPSTNPIWIEGPHIVKKDGWYYLICAEGGTAEQHSQVALRSRRPDGPYTPNPNNPILTQRDLPYDRPNPVTSAGHADLVQLPNGDWWATFLAVRPYGPYEDDTYNTGRETFLLPVEWVDGWPRITEHGEVIEPVHARPALPPAPAPAMPMSGPFAVRYEFDADALGPEWLMMRNPRSDWYALAGGALRLDARAARLADQANPSFLARRQQHLRAQAATRVAFAPSDRDDAAGLVALQSDDYWYALLIEQGTDGGRVLRVAMRDGPEAPPEGRTLATAPLPGPTDTPVDLRITGTERGYSFAYATAPDAWQPLHADADATLLSTKRAGGFVGVVFGLYATTGEGATLTER